MEGLQTYKKILKHILNILPLSIGIYFIQNQMDEIQRSIKELLDPTRIKYIGIVISITLGFLSHYLRAVRWKIQLTSIGISTENRKLFAAIMSGYLINLGLPRAGELYRCKVVTDQHSGTSYQTVLGTIITERVIDLLMLLMCFLIAIFLQTDLSVEFKSILNKLSPFSLITIIILGFTVISIKSIRFWLFDKFENIWIGISSIRSNTIPLYSLLTTLIWICYFFMTYSIKYSVPLGTTFPISMYLDSFISGSIAMATTNGGIGTYPYAISKVFEYYGATITDGLMFGWIMWLSQTGMVLVLGFSSLFFLKKS